MKRAARPEHKEGDTHVRRTGIDGRTRTPRAVATRSASTKRTAVHASECPTRRTSSRHGQWPETARRATGSAISVLRTAVLALGLAPLFISGAAAQAPRGIQVFHATMTVGYDEGNDTFGYRRGSSITNPYGSLSDTDFRFDGADYTVTRVGVTDGTLTLFLSEPLSQADAADLVLSVGGRAFRFSEVDAFTDLLNLRAWADSGLSWATGDTVDVRIIDTRKPSAPTNLRAEKSGRYVTVQWDDPGDTAGADIFRYEMKVWKTGPYATTEPDTWGIVPRMSDVPRGPGRSRTYDFLSSGIWRFKVRAMNRNAVFGEAATITETFDFNRAPTGKPTISGTARIGETITVDVGPVNDRDGTPPENWEEMLPAIRPSNNWWQYRLVRQGQSFSSESCYHAFGQNESTFKIGSGLGAERVQAVVCFIDNAGNWHLVTSDPWPSTTILADARAPELLEDSAHTHVQKNGNKIRIQFDEWLNPGAFTPYPEDTTPEGPVLGKTCNTTYLPRPGAFSVSVDGQDRGNVTRIIVEGCFVGAWEHPGKRPFRDRPNGTAVISIPGANVRPGQTVRLSYTRVMNDSRALQDWVRNKVASFDVDLANFAQAGPPTVAVERAEAHESRTQLISFKVTLRPASTEVVQVDYRTEEGTATAPEDYRATQGTLTFMAGETEKTVHVSIVDDSHEDSGEFFILRLSDPVNAVLGKSGASGTIHNIEGGGSALDARLVDVPEAHAGESFDFELDFGEETQVSYRTLRDSAFHVVGGEVTAATRKRQGSNQHWTITVDPQGSEDVTVTLPASSDCAASGAFCTSDNRAIATTLTTTVPHATQNGGPVAFNVELDAPSEHDGSGEIALTVRFNKEPVGYGWRTMRDHTIKVMRGGTRVIPTRVARRTRGSNKGWTVEVAPGGNEDLTVSIGPFTTCSDAGAVCAANHEVLSNAASKTIQGPPGLSVADARVEEAAGATVDFAVTLARASSETVAVVYATSDGTATAGSDYTGVQSILTFAPGETSKTVSVAVLDDAIDEDSESFTITLSNASGGYAYLTDATATGTITNDDHMPNAWLARFGRTVASQAVDAIGARLQSDRGSHVTVAGVSVPLAGEAALGEKSEHVATLLEALTSNDDDTTRSLTGREVLRGSAFQLSSREGPGAPAWTAWGRIATGEFEAEVDDTRLDGEVTSGFLGADVGGGRWLAGLALGTSKGEGDFALIEGGDGGSVESTLTAVYPYAQMDVSETVDIWGLAGFGSGELTLDLHAGDERLTDERYRTDIDMHLGAIGARGEVLSPAEPGDLTVRLKSDAFWVRTSSDAVRSETGNLGAAEADVTRLRLLAESSWSIDTAGGGTMTPTLEVGVRHDGGDAETGTGLEAGAGLAYSAGALTVEGRVRMLVAHEAPGYEEWGASGSVRLDPGASGRGLSLIVSPSWGTTQSATSRLWSINDGGALASEREFEAGRDLDAEVGYGLTGPGRVGVITPFAGMRLGDAGSADGAPARGGR